MIKNNSYVFFNNQKNGYKIYCRVLESLNSRIKLFYLENHKVCSYDISLIDLYKIYICKEFLEKLGFKYTKISDNFELFINRNLKSTILPYNINKKFATFRNDKIIYYKVIDGIIENEITENERFLKNACVIEVDDWDKFFKKLSKYDSNLNIEYGDKFILSQIMR